MVNLEGTLTKSLVNDLGSSASSGRTSDITATATPMHATECSDLKWPAIVRGIMARSSMVESNGSARLHFLRLIAENKREPVFTPLAIGSLDSASRTR
jgi:hypothetical protein